MNRTLENHSQDHCIEMVFEARKKALSAPSKVPPNLATCHKPLILYGFYGGDDGARTRDLCRDSLLVLGFSTTYKPVGNA